MSQPLYFLPGVSRETLAGVDPHAHKINRALLAERGLAGVFADVTDRECVAFELHETPGGKAGCFLYYKTVAGRDPLVTTYKQSSQDWHDVNKGLWIGVEKDSPPTEQDLRRRKISPWVAPIGAEMAGQEWTIPVIRRIDGATSLPTQLVLTESGELEKPVHPNYRDQWERFQDIADWAITSTIQLSEVALLRRAIEALSINYRYGLHEQNVLRYIDSEAFPQILFMAVDKWGAEQLAAAQKKTSSFPSDVNSTAGRADSCETTPQPMESCTLPLSA